MKTFDLDHVNIFVLQKHHLTDDALTEDILKIVKDIGGLHATLSTTPYLSLFCRAKSFKRENLDDLTYTRRLLGKVRYARKTVYILPKESITTAYSAIKDLLLLRFEDYIQYLGHSQEEYEKISKKIMKIVRGSGKTTKEIKTELDRECNVSAIVNLMCDHDLLIRGQPKPGWKSNIHTYYVFDEYFPDLNLSEMDEGRAKEQMVRQYLSSYGPVTVSDIAWWTGFPKGNVKQILEVLHKELVSIEISGFNDPYVMLSVDKERMNSLKLIEESQVHLLPALDPYLMGYKDRGRLLDEKAYDFIYDRSGNATYSILINGQIKGVWDWIAQKEPEIRLFYFNKIPAAVKNIIHSKAAKMGHFLFDKAPRITEKNSMIPLNKRTMGGFMSPLK